MDVSRIDITTIESLAPIMTIVAPYNPTISPDYLHDLQNIRMAHASLFTLRQFPTAYALLMDVLEQPLVDIPAWIWTYKFDKGGTSSTEQQLIQTIRFILTDYVNNCTSAQVAPCFDIGERRFLGEYVLPIFKSLARQTGTLCFNWCEVQLKQQTYQSRVMINAGQLDGMNLRFVDGLGIDVNGNERLVLEISGGHATDNHQHASDDTLKIIHSLMCILKGDAQNHINASFTTYRRIKAFGVQTVKDTVILSEMMLADNFKYVYKEIMTATVPVNDNHRCKWLPMFDLLAYLILQLDEQLAHIKRLQEEHSGRHPVDMHDLLFSALCYQQQDV
ncbi:hypothetical protein DM01DRAFT_1295877 [Hesseltinella vesiculosa]|uniref:Uncharacterized protein n=1 Tax=Hesseltinella vesiculosa TaxID=101127 RepID=A0A1X2G370_9FUNG|nr:hypothetical protein DM01DRAFT_1295877 [Hesseltinella vesiculosa]